MAKQYYIKDGYVFSYGIYSYVENYLTGEHYDVMFKNNNIFETSEIMPDFVVNFIKEKMKGDRSYV